MNKRVKQVLYNDLYRISGKTKYIDYLKQQLNPEFRMICVFRKINYKYQSTNNRIIKEIYRLKIRNAYKKYGYEIELGATIGEGFRLIHFGAVAISPLAVIGKNVTIFKGVTVGTQRRGRKMGAPTIGDKVWIGSNATIVGKINIGSDVLVAPNSYVNFDVPDHSICIGNPAVIISRENATDQYIDYEIV